MMTMIDLSTGWFEVAAINNGANTVEAQRFSSTLPCYPRPKNGFDCGSEFKAELHQNQA